MLDINIYGDFETAWCPGCGNYDILDSVKKAFAICDLPPEKILMVSGIGQAAKAPQYIKANYFNGLHGRALPVATGAKLANKELTVVVESGDGCMYGEGGNHFTAAIRRNIDITLLVHNNGIYGLTKGQASPTSTDHLTTKSQPFGIISTPFNPVAAAIVLGAGFVARGFSGDKDHLPGLIAEAIKFPGLALLDILSPCVSYNKYNTFAWYKKHCVHLPADYDPNNMNAALEQAFKWEEGIPLGVLYRQEGRRPTMETHFPMLDKGPLALQPVDMEVFKTFQNSFL